MLWGADVSARILPSPRFATFPAPDFSTVHRSLWGIWKSPALAWSCGKTISQWSDLLALQCRLWQFSSAMSDFDSRDAGRKQEFGSLADLFADAELVFVYTRAQAIEDGTLVDVSKMAKEAGFVYPVAVTATLWADIEAISEEYAEFEDVQGRLWDVLYMGHMAILHSKGDESELLYKLILHTGGNEEYTVKLVCGPGDNREPVITLMQPDED